MISGCPRLQLSLDIPRLFLRNGWKEAGVAPPATTRPSWHVVHHVGYVTKPVLVYHHQHRYWQGRASDWLQSKRFDPSAWTLERIPWTWVVKSCKMMSITTSRNSWSRAKSSKLRKLTSIPKGFWLNHWNWFRPLHSQPSSSFRNFQRELPKHPASFLEASPSWRIHSSTVACSWRLPRLPRLVESAKSADDMNWTRSGVAAHFFSCANSGAWLSAMPRANQRCWPQPRLHLRCRHHRCSRRRVRHPMSSSTQNASHTCCGPCLSQTQCMSVK